MNLPWVAGLDFPPKMIDPPQVPNPIKIARLDLKLGCFL
jgi:hypothetical protein